jgi:hypothetical protein
MNNRARGEVRQVCHFAGNQPPPPVRPSRVWQPRTVGACLFAAIAVTGCGAHVSGGQPHATSGHGSLTVHEYALATSIALDEVRKQGATTTSATATIGQGTVSDPNAGPACLSGRVLHITLTGTFARIVTGGVTGAPNEPVSTVLITADAASGGVCLISVRTGSTPTPEPGAAVLAAR